MRTFDFFLFPPIEPGTDVGLLALRPMLVAGMAQPVVDGDGGINIAAMTNFPEGLLCAINPYIGMNRGSSRYFLGRIGDLAEKGGGR